MSESAANDLPQPQPLVLRTRTRGTSLFERRNKAIRAKRGRGGRRNGNEVEGFLQSRETGRAVDDAFRAVALFQKWAVANGIEADIVEELIADQFEFVSKPHRLTESLNQVSLQRYMAAKLASFGGEDDRGMRDRTVPVLTSMSPFPQAGVPVRTPKERYEKMSKRLEVANSSTTGIHHHGELIDAAGNKDEMTGVRAMERLNPALYYLIALAAGSPIPGGLWTSWESNRIGVFGSNPTYYHPTKYDSPEAHRQEAERIFREVHPHAEKVDLTQVYANARISENNPTLEVRVCDVALLPETQLAIDHQAKVMLADAIWGAETDTPSPYSPLLNDAIQSRERSASQAGFSDGTIRHPLTGEVEKVPVVINDMRDYYKYVFDELDPSGQSFEEFSQGLAIIRDYGTSASMLRDLTKQIFFEQHELANWNDKDRHEKFEEWTRSKQLMPDEVAKELSFAITYANNFVYFNQNVAERQVDNWRTLAQGCNEDKAFGELSEMKIWIETFHPVAVRHAVGLAKGRAIIPDLNRESFDSGTFTTTDFSNTAVVDPKVNLGWVDSRSARELAKQHYDARLESVSLEASAVRPTPSISLQKDFRIGIELG